MMSSPRFGSLVGLLIGSALITTSYAHLECGLPVGGSSTTAGRRRRQIIFPDELESFLEFKKNQKAAAMSGALTDGSPVPPSDISINVTDAFCGATLIHERYLVTAAHCVFDPDRPVRTVRLGELDFSQENEANSKPADYDVEEIIVHPEYNPESLVRYHDFALIKTRRKVEFNDVVFPFCVPNVRPAPDTLVIGSGFGYVNNSDHRAPILQEAEFNIVDAAKCENDYFENGLGDAIRSPYPELLQGKDILCATFPGRDACSGDSGGPLFLEEADGRRFLVGVVGAGITCRANGVSPVPGFYVSVADHIDFINDVIFGP